MSSRESTQPSASPRTSTSSPTGTSASPNTRRSGLRGGGDRRASSQSLGSTGIPRTNGESTYSYAYRGSGGRNILNPAEAQRSIAPGTGTNIGNVSDTGESTSAFSSSPSTSRPAIFPGQSLGQQPTSHATGSPQTLVPPLGDRGSSTLSYPAHTMGTARRLLTPQSPRRASVTQAQIQQRTSPQHPQYFSTGPLESSRGFLAEPTAPGHPTHPPSTPGTTVPRPLAPQYVRQEPPGGPPSSLAPLAPPTRSMSQPLLGQPNPPPPQQESRQDQARLGGQTRPQHDSNLNFNPSQQPPPTYPLPIAPDPRGFQSSPAPVVPSGWPGEHGGPLQYGGTAIRGLAGAEGNTHFQIQPSQGEAITVPVDFWQGSKQADGKRKRNACASARFRKKKREESQNMVATNQRLEANNRGLEDRVRELEARERETERRLRYMESDRARLHGIVARTQGISELAGPLSPPAADPPSTQPFEAAAATAEMASPRRRRRPQSQIELPPPPTYGPHPGSTLPPMTQPAFATPLLSHPSTPSAAPSTRLAPMRLDQQQPAGTPTPGPPSNTSTAAAPAQGQPTFKREPSDTIWPPARRGPDPGQR
ncbi:hypothetical protein GGR56DRAFT_270764 [Xylariaceae sp. FL0804]|nr:hypothetical protein GGR56DRAFT_270764 [Xylariaceae sp. FL0804]